MAKAKIAIAINLIIRFSHSGSFETMHSRGFWLTIVDPYQNVLGFWDCKESKRPATGGRRYGIIVAILKKTSGADSESKEKTAASHIATSIMTVVQS